MTGEDSLSQWVMTERLGQGGNGEVWKARRRAGGEVALKVLKETNENNESYRRFTDEIQILRLGWPTWGPPDPRCEPTRPSLKEKPGVAGHATGDRH
jgi:hypothetical protein